MRQRLFDARSLRVAPATDDKVLASWNGLALSAFAEAARMLGRDDYAAVATDLAGFLTTTMRPGQRIHHAWRAGVLRRECFAEDQAAVALGLVDLYETSFEPRWLGIARELADALVEDFGAADGSFYDTASDADGLVVRPRDLMDNATPAATSLAADLLAPRHAHGRGSLQRRRPRGGRCRWAPPGAERIDVRPLPLDARAPRRRSGRGRDSGPRS